MEREKEATYNGDDLDCTQPELEFTKEFDSEVVDGDDGEQKHGDPNTRIDFFVGFPFLYDQGRRSELIWRGDNILAPVRPAESKSESRVAKTGSIASKTRRVRDPCSHFAESGHYDVDKKTNRSVSDEDRARAVVC